MRISIVCFVPQSNSKTEAEIDLRAATVEWTEDKSRRNNVFQLTTHFDLQMLFQVDDKEKAEEWYQDIKRVTDKSEMVSCPRPLSEIRSYF